MEQNSSQLVVQVEELKRDLEIARGEEVRYRKLYEETRHQVDSFQPEREMLENKIQVSLDYFICTIINYFD